MIITTSKLKFTICNLCLSLNLIATASLVLSKPLNAQGQPNPNIPITPRDIDPPPKKPFEEPELPQPLPPPEDLLPRPTPSEPDFTVPNNIFQTIIVKKFVVSGSTIFDQEDFEKITAAYINRPVTMAELFQVRSEITKLYVNEGYITSGAFIPPQKFRDGVVEIKVLEGSLEDIQIRGNQKLKPSYVRSRLAIATKKPLNRKKLLKALQLLQLNP